MSSTAQPVLDFKSATLYAVRLVLRSADTAKLIASLNERLDAAPDFFEGEPVVIDATQLEAAAPRWGKLADALRRRGLAVVGVAAQQAWEKDIRAAGLAAVHLPAGREAAAIAAGSVHRDPPLAQSEAEEPAPAEIVAQAGVAQMQPEPESVAPQAANASGTGSPTLIIDRSLRSGQKVYARGADLVVIGMISPGAEVIADGSIHVYGPLRGKAMAGARGDESARIFTTRLDAELVAVAGIYRVVDTKLPENVQERPATVRLHAGALTIEPLAV